MRMNKGAFTEFFMNRRLVVQMFEVRRFYCWSQCIFKNPTIVHIVDKQSINVRVREEVNYNLQL